MDLDRWRVAAGDLLLGSVCHGCGVPAWRLCEACRVRLAQTAPRRVRPDPCPPDLPPVWAAGPYDDLAKGLVSAHKDRQALGLTPVLGERLALATLALLTSTGHARGHRRTGVRIALVPVPSAPATVRARGFDAGLALARAAAARLPGGLDVCVEPVLVHTRRLADQSGLGAQERWRNLAGGHRVRRSPRAALVVVVDDVVTTGASLSESVRALRAAGTTVLGGACVAATTRVRSR